MIVRAADAADHAEVHELLSSAFKQEPLVHAIVSVTCEADPNFRRGDLRVVEAGGKIVSMMMLIRRPLRIGTAIVKGAIVSPVGTHPDHKGKGYCSAVMRDAVRYMRAQGFDLSILWGVPWLYPHYGYSPAMMRPEVLIKPEQGRPVEADPCERRAFTESDLGQMTRIYHKNTEAISCAEIRSPTMSHWKPSGSKAKLEVFTDKKARVIGYCSIGTDWGRPCAHEIGVLNHEACGIIYNGLLETAKEKGFEELRCLVHPDHPFARFALWHKAEIRISSFGGAGMARVLNLPSLLSKMERELEQRLCRSELHNTACTLKIASEEDAATLSINHGKVSASPDNSQADYELEIPLASLNPLVTGCKDICELAATSKLKIKGGKQATQLIKTLFPRGTPTGSNMPLFWE